MAPSAPAQRVITPETEALLNNFVADINEKLKSQLAEQESEADVAYATECSEMASQVQSHRDAIWRLEQEKQRREEEIETLEKAWSLRESQYEASQKARQAQFCKDLAARLSLVASGILGQPDQMDSSPVLGPSPEEVQVAVSAPSGQISRGPGTKSRTTRQSRLYLTESEAQVGTDLGQESIEVDPRPADSALTSWQTRRERRQHKSRLSPHRDDVRTSALQRSQDNTNEEDVSTEIAHEPRSRKRTRKVVEEAEETARLVETDVHSQRQASASPTSAPPKKKTKLSGKTTVQFKKLFSNGKLGEKGYKHFIEEYPKNSNEWYIFVCAQHKLEFGAKPILSARKHLNGKSHGHMSKNYDTAIRELGIRVVGCNADLAEQNNKAFIQAIAEGTHEPVYILKSRQQRLTQEIQAQQRGNSQDWQDEDDNSQAAISAAQGKKRQQQQHPSKPQQQSKSKSKSSAQRLLQPLGAFYGICDPAPVVGELYQLIEEKSRYIVTPLPWSGELSEIGLSCSIQRIVGLFTEPPECYKHIGEVITGWEHEYEDGGRLVTRREFPCLVFNDDFEEIPIDPSIEFSIPQPNNNTKDALYWVHAQWLRPADFADKKHRKLFGQKAGEEFKTRREALRNTPGSKIKVQGENKGDNKHHPDEDDSKAQKASNGHGSTADVPGQGMGQMQDVPDVETQHNEFSELDSDTSSGSDVEDEITASHPRRTVNKDTSRLANHSLSRDDVFWPTIPAPAGRIDESLTHRGSSHYTTEQQPAQSEIAACRSNDSADNVLEGIFGGQQQHSLPPQPHPVEERSTKVDTMTARAERFGHRMRGPGTAQEEGVNDEFARATPLDAGGDSQVHDPSQPSLAALLFPEAENSTNPGDDTAIQWQRRSNEHTNGVAPHSKWVAVHGQSVAPGHMMSNRASPKKAREAIKGQTNGDIRNSKMTLTCFPCRARKIRCDGLEPHCANCMKNGRECLGYSPVENVSSSSESEDGSKHIAQSLPHFAAN